MKATELNVWTLAKVFNGATEIPNGALAPTEAPHLRRCMKAGLLEVVGGRRGALRLTSAGIDAVATAGWVVKS